LIPPQNRKIGRAPYSHQRLTGAATEDQTLKAALQNYHARMQRVLDHLDRHLDGDLDLETVSRVAAFSKFHFHRQLRRPSGCPYIVTSSLPV
jgi:AraC family transcriptional regulator